MSWKYKEAELKDKLQYQIIYCFVFHCLFNCSVLGLKKACSDPTSTYISALLQMHVTLNFSNGKIFAKMPLCSALAIEMYSALVRHSCAVMY